MMKKKKTGKRVLAVALAAALLAGTCPFYLPKSEAKTVMSEEEFKELLSTYSIGGAVPLYKEYVADKGDNRPDRVIEVDADSYSRYEENGISLTPDVYENYEGMAGTSIVTAENAIVEYDVTVPESGWYDLSMVYYPIEGKSSEIQ